VCLLICFSVPALKKKIISLCKDRQVCLVLSQVLHPDLKYEWSKFVAKLMDQLKIGLSLVTRQSKLLRS